MELLVKIALIIAIVISVTIFVVSMILSMAIVTIIFNEDKYDNTTPLPESFKVVISEVHNFMIVDTFKNINSPLEPPTTGEMYCKVMGGDYELMIVTEDIDMHSCGLDYTADLFWDDIFDYLPESFTTPIEIECHEIGGFPLIVPDTLGNTIPLCIMDGPNMEPYLHD